MSSNGFLYPFVFSRRPIKSHYLAFFVSYQLKTTRLFAGFSQVFQQTEALCYPLVFNPTVFYYNLTENLSDFLRHFVLSILRIGGKRYEGEKGIESHSAHFHVFSFSRNNSNILLFVSQSMSEFSSMILRRVFHMRAFLQNAISI